MVDGLARALLAWGVLYAGLFGAVGLTLIVARGLRPGQTSDRGILRAAALIAFLLALAAWLVLILAD